MKLNIYINDKLYKTVTVPGNKYEPTSFYAQIFADKEAGLLNTYNVQERMAVRYEVIEK